MSFIRSRRWISSAVTLPRRRIASKRENLHDLAGGASAANSAVICSCALPAGPQWAWGVLTNLPISVQLGQCFSASQHLASVQRLRDNAICSVGE